MASGPLRFLGRKIDSRRRAGSEGATTTDDWSDGSFEVKNCLA